MIPFTPENAREQAKKQLTDPKIAEHGDLLLDFTEAVTRRLLELTPVRGMMDAPVVHIRKLGGDVRAKTQKVATSPTVLVEDGEFDLSTFDQYAQEFAEELAEIYSSYLSRGADVYPYFVVRPTWLYLDSEKGEARFMLATRYGAKVWEPRNRNPRGH